MPVDFGRAAISIELRAFAMRFTIGSVYRKKGTVPTSRSLLGMSSKRDGNIQPSVRSQPPRFTARIGSPCAASILLASDWGRSHQEQTRRRRRGNRTRQRIWVSALVMVQMTTKLTKTLAYIDAAGCGCPCPAHRCVAARATYVVV